MASIKETLARAAKALTGSPSAAELREVRREAQGRLTEVETRLEKIREGGAEYARVLREGSTDDLVKLEREAETLGAELKQLRARLKELRTKERHAQATEAVRDARAMKDSLAQTLKEAEDAAAAYERARTRTERQVRAIREAVRACSREDVDSGALLVDAATIERAAALLPAPGKSQHDVKRELARDIGAPAQGKRQQSAPEPKGRLVGEG